MSPLAYIGLTLHGALFIALLGVCGFDEGQIAHDWTDCVIPLGLLAAPFVIASLAVARRSSNLLTWAAGIGGLLGFLSLTGPGLFVLVPAVLYGISAASSGAGTTRPNTRVDSY